MTDTRGEIMQYTRDDVLARLGAAEYSTPEAKNKWIDLRLEPGDSAWDPASTEGTDISTSGSLTYMQYRDGGIYADLTPGVRADQLEPGMRIDVSDTLEDETVVILTVSGLRITSRFAYVTVGEFLYPLVIPQNDFVHLANSGD